MLPNLILTLLVVASMFFVGVGRAEANPRYAAFVIDAKTGQVLFSRHAEDARYPASLTKMMTLYLVFEALADGRISISSRIPISAKAAAEAPTKIGLPAGATIGVEDAIEALVTKSANDISTAIAEFLGGSEQRFARIMTDKARQIGMKSTTFRNAHGLPNNEQRTTARDMAILGIALREHFPQYYHYFSLKSAVVAGKRYGNHNNLLGRLKGVDGIKTGYIRASGFNLVSSVETGGRSIVAVVMGGRTSRTRDAHMVELINTYLPRASKGSSGPLLASRGKSAPLAVASAQALPKTDIPTPVFRPTPVIHASAPIAANAYAAPEKSAVVPPMPVAEAEAESEVMGEGSVDPVATSSTSRDGWAVQVAAAPSESEARILLEKMTQRAPDLLGSADPFTEVYSKGGITYYRVRFGGFTSKDAAWNTCHALKRKKIDCYAAQL